MEMSDRELDRILAEQARDRDRREAAARSLRQSRGWRAN
jgi:hypothetical protein